MNKKREEEDEKYEFIFENKMKEKFMLHGNFSLFLAWGNFNKHEAFIVIWEWDDDDDDGDGNGDNADVDEDGSSSEDNIDEDQQKGYPQNDTKLKYHNESFSNLLYPAESTINRWLLWVYVVLSDIVTLDLLWEMRQMRNNNSLTAIFHQSSNRVNITNCWIINLLLYLDLGS